MPTPPDLGYFDKVNYVIDAWAQPCEAPWYIYVSTLKPALLAAFITLITFGWDDVARGWARPPDRHSRRRSGKKRGKGGRGFRRFPEFGEAVGRQLPGSEAVKGINWSDGLKTLWRIDSVVQGVLFAWLVADVTIDFGFEWTSLLYETRWCQESARGRFSWHKAQNDLHAANAWSTVPYRVQDYQFPFPIWTGGQGSTGSKGATVTFSANFIPFDPLFPPGSYDTRLIDTVSGRVYAEGGPNQADPDGSGIGIASGNVPPGAMFRVQVKSNGGWCWSTAGAVLGIEDLL